MCARVSALARRHRSFVHLRGYGVPAWRTRQHDDDTDPASRLAVHLPSLRHTFGAWVARVYT